MVRLSSLHGLDVVFEEVEVGLTDDEGPYFGGDEICVPLFEDEVPYLCHYNLLFLLAFKAFVLI